MIGFIHSASPHYFEPFGGAFRAGLKETGYIEHKNVGIEYRWAEGHYDRLPVLVADLLDRKVNVIFAAGGTDPAKRRKRRRAQPLSFLSARPIQSGPALSRASTDRAATSPASACSPPRSTARNSTSCAN